MGLGDRLDQGEAQPGSAGRAGAGGVTAGEPFEGRRHQTLGQTGAVVVDGQDGA